MKIFLTERKRNVFYLSLYVFFIYASLPFAPAVWRFIAWKLGKGASSIPFVLLSIVILSVFLYIFRFKKRSFPSYCAVAATGLLYFIGMLHVELPAEKLHFLEYAGVGYFSYRVYRDMKKRYMAAILTVVVISLFDEAIQYLLPNRVFEIRDIAVNIFGGILGLVIVKFSAKKE